jgi:hypothetical protein
MPRHGGGGRTGLATGASAPDTRVDGLEAEGFFSDRREFMVNAVNRLHLLRPKLISGHVPAALGQGQDR